MPAIPHAVLLLNVFESRSIIEKTIHVRTISMTNEPHTPSLISLVLFYLQFPVQYTPFTCMTTTINSTKSSVKILRFYS
jgi:hypothetical protein